MGFLSSLFGSDSGKATQKAAKQNTALLGGLDTRGQGYISQGEQQSQGFLGQIGGLYDKYAGMGDKAGNLYEGALGLNGPAGNDAAAAAYRTAPGYEFKLAQGEQAAQRAAAAGGMLSSGNTLAALTEYGQGVADQDFGSWLTRLQGLQTQGLQAQQFGTAGKASGLTGLAGLAQTVGTQRLGLDASVVNGKLGANNQFAQGKEQQAADGGILGNALGSFIGNLGSKVNPASVFKGF